MYATDPNAPTRRIPCPSRRVFRTALTLATMALTFALATGSRVAAAAPFVATQALAAKADPWVLQQFTQRDAVPLIVQLPTQADLSAAERLRDKTERARYVFETLRAHADAAQRALRAWLDARGIAHRAFWINNTVFLSADAAVANELAARPDVARLGANPSVRLELPAQPATRFDMAKSTQGTLGIETGVAKIGAPALWAAGFTGQGIVIAGADTGYAWSHPALKAAYRGWNGVSANHNYHWHDAIHTGGGVCGANSPVPCDDGSHGTHTMGTMVGDDGAGTQIGVAPGARWIGCRNMDQGNGTPATYTECFQWFLAPTDLSDSNPDPAKAPHVINNSWACPPFEGCTDVNALKSVVEAVRAAGILVVASAGNRGSSGCGSVDWPPATYEASFSVGASNGGSAVDAMADFSSRGPVTVDGSNRLKPDIVAPGVGVISSIPGGGYGAMSGTSMAGPHVVGAAALLMSAHPELIGNPDAIIRTFKRTAVRHVSAMGCGSIATTVPNNEYGWGRIDVAAAHTNAPGATFDVDHTAWGVPAASASDGVLIVRYLFGIRGARLVAGALAGDATLTDPNAIEARLAALLPALDIDGDGERLATRDGLLVVRFLLGLRGNALIQGAAAASGTRTTAADIEAYLALLTPPL